MAEDDVGHLECQEGIEVAQLLGAVCAGDAGGVDEALGEDDGVTDGQDSRGSVSRVRTRMGRVT